MTTRKQRSPAKENQKMAESLADKARKAKADFEKYRQGAIDELLAARDEFLRKNNEALAELDYQAPTAKVATSAPKKQRQRDPNKPCGICNFVTAPPHDGRVHRSQGDKKRPFTDKELAAQGMKKVS